MNLAFGMNFDYTVLTGRAERAEIDNLQIILKNSGCKVW